VEADDLRRAEWRKSTHSGGNGSCVEVAAVRGSKEASGHVIAVRDSKNRGGPVLTFTPAAWDAFTAGVRDGEFDQG
jgi:Domain of unknown function (DUF397)